MNENLTVIWENDILNADIVCNSIGGINYT